MSDERPVCCMLSGPLGEHDQECIYWQHNPIPGWHRQTRPADDSPHAWIQWKGTDVCMDIRCPCGELSHIDADFTYYVECPGCHQRYMTNGHIELVPLTSAESEAVADQVKIGN